MPNQDAQLQTVCATVTELTLEKTTGRDQRERMETCRLPACSQCMALFKADVILSDSYYSYSFINSKNILDPILQVNPASLNRIAATRPDPLRSFSQK